jgi:hypothetical protein
MIQGPKYPIHHSSIDASHFALIGRTLKKPITMWCFSSHNRYGLESFDLNSSLFEISGVGLVIRDIYEPGLLKEVVSRPFYPGRDDSYLTFL